MESFHSSHSLVCASAKCAGEERKYWLKGYILFFIILMFAMYIEIKDETSHSVQRFSVKCGCVWHLFSEVPLLLRAVSAGGEVAVMSWLLVTKLRTCGKLSTLIIWTLHYKQTMYMAPSHCVLCTAQSFVCIYRQMTYQPLCSSGTAPLED